MMVRGDREDEESSTSSSASSTIFSSEEETDETRENSNRQRNDKQQTAAAVTSAVSLNTSDDDNGNNASPSWDNLPSVILLEIFTYLPHENRIQASQVCRNWRYTLFHPSFWKKITFNLTDSDSILWSRCLSNWFKFSVQEVTIRCESSNAFVREALYVLQKLSENRQLRKLFLEPSKCMFEYPNQEVNGDNLLRLLLNIVETSNSLEALSLGCIEELAEDLICILEPLKNRHANRLTHLALASVKDDPERYDFLELDGALFTHFQQLSILTIDYDHLSDDLLLALTSGLMQRLVIHVHGWNGEYEGASNSAWIAFTQKNPQCELRLSLIHSYNAVRVLDSEILQPAMPLTHLKVLFCESVNTVALHRISLWYPDSLQSIIWINSFNSTKNLSPPSFDFYDEDNPDPLVLAAWRCKNLNEIVFIGQKYLLDCVIAIVRLRHDALKRLEFGESNIVYEESWSDREAIIEEVKEVMGKQWKFINDEELPKVVINSHSGDSREVIMPMVLRDQK
ncbi:F-box only protein 33 [Phymastichus coffea]|uniref:F-box only protein 33 n=1 Tax=Phymastichus coffea TaxID=108790 RepID=UPI00273BF3C0|nr:F-box only protein 33 [Phymastichus coffea]